jgi:hypothetical protein
VSVALEEIFKRKLLIEGEGGSDDLRTTRLLKTFIKWAGPNEPEDEMLVFTACYLIVLLFLLLLFKQVSLKFRYPMAFGL